MEIERYTLATGETALTGFNRYGKHWGLFFALMTYFANLWPGWATSSASMLTYLFGAGDPRWIAIGILLVIGAILTFAPVVYVMLERLIFVKIAAVALLVVLALIFAIRGKTYSALGHGITHPEFPVQALGFALMMGAIAYAGAGGGQNLCQSNWIRDKGFGQGQHVPRLTSPVTGEQEADREWVHLPAGPGEPSPLAPLVEVRQRGTGPDVRRYHGGDDRLHLDAGPRHPVR
jgi:hypothetical protein